jgi:hypothetical protein
MVCHISIQERCEGEMIEAFYFHRSGAAFDEGGLILRSTLMKNLFAP